MLMPLVIVTVALAAHGLPSMNTLSTYVVIGAPDEPLTKGCTAWLLNHGSTWRATTTHLAIIGDIYRITPDSVTLWATTVRQAGTIYLQIPCE